MEDVKKRLEDFASKKQIKLAERRYRNKATKNLEDERGQGNFGERDISREQLKLFSDWADGLIKKAQRPVRPRRPKEVVEKEKKERVERVSSRKAVKETVVKIPILPDHVPEVDVPEWYAAPTRSKITGKLTGYTLMNPFTKERRLATRKGEAPLDLRRKEVDHTTAEKVDAAEIPLSMFKPSQREAAKKYNDELKRLDAAGVDPTKRPDRSKFQNKERGRPTELPKNIQWWEENGERVQAERERRDSAKKQKAAEKKKRYTPPVELEPPPPAEETKRRGRPTKHATDEEKKAAKLESNRRRKLEREEEVRKALELATKKKGKGFAEMVNKAKQSVSHQFEVLGKKASRTASALVTGIDNYSRPARDMLRKYGEQMITKMEIGRTPVQSAITAALNVVSMGQFEKQNPYDTLFHLFLKLTIGGKQISLEKNEVITISEWKSRDGTEFQDVALGNPVSLNELLGRAQKRMGDRFFKYDSASNNCQDFILNVLQASSLGTKGNFEFVKQDTQSIFAGLSGTKKLAKSITDLGAKVNVLTQGAGIHIDINSHNGKNYKMGGEGAGKDYVVQSVVFPKDYGIPAARKWLKTNGYKSPKVDVEANTIRFRQLSPAATKKQGFTEYRNKEIGDGIMLVLCYKKMSGSSIKMPKLVKGSKEAKEFMQRMREMRGKKKSVGGSVEGTPVAQAGGGLYAGRGLSAGMGLYAGMGVGSDSDSESSSDEDEMEHQRPAKVVHHHHYHHPCVEGGAVMGIKHLDKKAAKVGKAAAKGALKKGITLGLTAAGTAAGAASGNPVAAALGAAAGKTAGDELGKMATKGLGLYAGQGVTKKPHMVKGSDAARLHMQKLREMRRK